MIMREVQLGCNLLKKKPSSEHGEGISTEMRYDWFFVGLINEHKTRLNQSASHEYSCPGILVIGCGSRKNKIIPHAAFVMRAWV